MGRRFRSLKGLAGFLRRVEESEDQELVYAPRGGWWIGDDPVHGGWPRFALLAGVVSLAQDSKMGSGMERYTVNGCGRKLLADPSSVPELLAHVMGRS